MPLRVVGGGFYESLLLLSPFKRPFCPCEVPLTSLDWIHSESTRARNCEGNSHDKQAWDGGLKPPWPGGLVNNHTHTDGEEKAFSQSPGKKCQSKWDLSKSPLSPAPALRVLLVLIVCPYDLDSLLGTHGLLLGTVIRSSIQFQPEHSTLNWNDLGTPPQMAMYKWS